MYSSNMGAKCSSNSIKIIAKCVPYFICLIAHVFETIQNINKAFSSTYTFVYQSRLILSALFQHDLINVSYLTACYLYQVMMTLHVLNDVANDMTLNQHKHKELRHNH